MISEEDIVCDSYRNLFAPLTQYLAKSAAPLGCLFSALLDHPVLSDVKCKTPKLIKRIVSKKACFDYMTDSL